MMIVHGATDLTALRDDHRAESGDAQGIPDEALRRMLRQ